MRLFIAALLPEEIRNELTGFVDSLRHDIDGVKWEKPEKLHITLKFLGNVEASRVDEIINILDNLVSEFSSFSVKTKEFSGFPNLRNPRVLYVGLSNNLGFSKFASDLDEQLSGLGFEKESRKFIPHITVGRVKKKIKLDSNSSPPLAKFEIEKIGLIESVLKPSGSEYKLLKEFYLGKLS